MMTFLFSVAAPGTATCTAMVVTTTQSLEAPRTSFSRLLAHHQVCRIRCNLTSTEGISPVNHILLPFMHGICDFHPLPCPERASRFLTHKKWGKLTSKTRLAPLLRKAC